eukprot:GHVT01005008.1.p1 GENE.GHVT01005008.1~~GHVT01005008.1.p1  ORF type:complete len:108 (+),score=33.38 GHVT01005008.1:983-1306(+)
MSLLKDQAGAVAEKWNVGKTAKLIPGRATFVVDKKGQVADVYRSQFKFRKHARRALAVVDSLQKKEKKKETTREGSDDSDQDKDDQDELEDDEPEEEEKKKMVDQDD